jgi:hypothetical protein
VPDEEVAEREVNATVKEVTWAFLLLAYVWTEIRLPVYFAVSMPPNRIEPLVACKSFSHKL